MLRCLGITIDNMIKNLVKKWFNLVDKKEFDEMRDMFTEERNEVIRLEDSLKEELPKKKRIEITLWLIQEHFNESGVHPRNVRVSTFVKALGKELD